MVELNDVMVSVDSAFVNRLLLICGFQYREYGSLRIVRRSIKALC